jgi:hypothetical protein
MLQRFDGEFLKTEQSSPGYSSCQGGSRHPRPDRRRPMWKLIQRLVSTSTLSMPFPSDCLDLGLNLLVAQGKPAAEA